MFVQCQKCQYYIDYETDDPTIVDRKNRLYGDFYSLSFSRNIKIDFNRFTDVDIETIDVYVCPCCMHVFASE